MRRRQCSEGICGTRAHPSTRAPRTYSSQARLHCSASSLFNEFGGGCGPRRRRRTCVCTQSYTVRCGAWDNQKCTSPEVQIDGTFYRVYSNASTVTTGMGPRQWRPCIADNLAFLIKPNWRCWVQVPCGLMVYVRDAASSAPQSSCESDWQRRLCRAGHGLCSRRNGTPPKLLLGG